jgi:hypothetical protein
MQDYQHWYPEEVTFQPKLHESAMSREFLRKSLGPEGAAMLAASGEERHMALVNRLYASYEKVRPLNPKQNYDTQVAVASHTTKELFILLVNNLYASYEKVRPSWMPQPCLHVSS